MVLAFTELLPRSSRTKAALRTRAVSVVYGKEV
jgi:hypothetical protein